MRFRLALLIGTVVAGSLPAQSPAPPREVAHKWAVTPAFGEWMVCVKSYTGPNARAEAEEFAGFVRAKYDAAAYLFEHGQEERLAQEKRRQELIRERQAEAAPFLRTQAQLKAEAQSKGQDFVPAPVRIRVPVVTARTQWAVLVGGWKDMDLASGALKTVRGWKELPPERLLDRATISGGNSGVQGQYVNPFAVAMVCPNPSIAKAKPDVMPLDPFVVKLNEHEPLSVLKIQKGWTLIVKDFPVPTETRTQGQEGSAIGRALGLTNEGKYLERTAIIATEFANTIRGEPMQQAARAAAQKLGLNAVTLDSYVLHLRTGSRVTVGQFDSLDDPALEQTQRLLSNMTFQIQNTPGGPVVDERRMFDGITPMPVPKVK